MNTPHNYDHCSNFATETNIYSIAALQFDDALSLRRNIKDI